MRTASYTGNKASAQGAHFLSKCPPEATWGALPRQQGKAQVLERGDTPALTVNGSVEANGKSQE